MSTPLAEIFKKYCKKNLLIFVIPFFSVYKQWLAMHRSILSNSSN